MFIKPEDIVSDVTKTCDVCIVGSGSGGSVMALEMAQAGLSVIVLEDGGYHRGADFNQREPDMFGENYIQHNARTTKDTSITVMQGRCVGGGTAINGCDCVRIHDPVLAHWREKYGVRDLTPEALRPFVEKAERLMKVKEITEQEFNANNSFLKKGAQALGYRGEHFSHNRENCRSCGYCIIGCAYDVKQAGHTVHIPQAVDLGADVYTYARVERIVQNDGSANSVTGIIMDRKSERERARISVKANVVMLAANTINSPQILLNSKIANSSGQVGRNLSLQPQTPVVAVFDEAVTFYRGIPQAYAVTQFEEADEKAGLGGFRIECISGSPGLVAVQLPGFGLETKQLMKEYPHFASSMVLVPDQPSGEVTVNRHGRAVITYEMTDDCRRRLMEGMKEAARVYFAAGAKKVLYTYNEPVVLNDASETGIVDRLGIEPCSLGLVSSHHYGTCRMGEDPMTSVVDSYGESHDVRNLFVVDSSTHPTSSSSHNMVAVMALAHRTADYILKNRDRYFG